MWWSDAEFLGSLCEDDGFVGLFHGEGEEKCGEGYEDHAPLAPLPGLVLGYEAAHDGAGDVSVAVSCSGTCAYPSAGPAKGAARNMLVVTAR